MYDSQCTLWGIQKEFVIQYQSDTVEHLKNTFSNLDHSQFPKNVEIYQSRLSSLYTQFERIGLSDTQRHHFVYVAHVADRTCRRRLPVSCRRDMPYDMSDMSSSVAATCRDVAPLEGALNSFPVMVSNMRPVSYTHLTLPTKA